MILATTRRRYRVDRAMIAYFKFILEAYDNMAVVSTLDPCRGIVQVVTAPGCEALVGAIVAGLSQECGLCALDEPAGHRPGFTQANNDAQKTRIDPPA